MSGTELFKVEKDGFTAWLVLNRPERRNAMNFDFFVELADRMAALDQDPEVRVVVIKAEGQSFTAGLDLSALSSLVSSHGADARESLRQFILRGQASMTAVERCRKPVIAAVHSHCIGGGVDLLSACDIRLASQDAVFSVRETRLALVADLGTLQRLPYIVGDGVFRDLVYTGRDFTAAEALKMGFLSRVCADRAALYEEAGRVAALIASNSPLAVQGVKDTLRFTREYGVTAGLEYVAQKNAAILISEDMMEAVQAFMQKRPPEFKGR